MIRNFWHISDTHGLHNLLDVPDVDLVIFSGDEANSRDPYKNEAESRDFFDWFSGLDIPHKIFVPGNHSTAIEKGLIKGSEIEEMGVTYLENSSIELGGVKIWGSPWCPRYGHWAFMKKRSKLDEVWKHIPEDTDILVTHTPPKGSLDLSYDMDNNLEMCGCKALLRHVERVKPKYHLFGHIHNNKDIVNAGLTKRYGYDTVFSNGSTVTDGKFGRLSSHGVVFHMDI